MDSCRINLTRIEFSCDTEFCAVGFHQWICDRCLSELFDFFNKSEVKVTDDTKLDYFCENCRGGGEWGEYED